MANKKNKEDKDEILDLLLSDDDQFEEDEDTESLDEHMNSDDELTDDDEYLFGEEESWEIRQFKGENKKHSTQYDVWS